MTVNLSPISQLGSVSRDVVSMREQRSNMPIMPIRSIRQDAQASSLQGRVSICPPSSTMVIGALYFWKKDAEEGENREAAAASIMVFLQDNGQDRLSLKGYRLKSLPNIFDDSAFDRLKELDISWNWLTYLPSTIVKLKALEFLLAEENCLFELPEDMNKLSNLKRLRLYSNPFLTKLPANLLRSCIVKKDG